MSNAEIRVLHVDDDQNFVNLAKTILTQERTFIIETATSADEALIKLQKSSFDVIISDYDMPEKNGLELFKLIHQKAITTPFILFTGKGREEIAVQALNLGVDRYINKHGNPETVYTELSVAVRQLYEKTRAKKLLVESEERWHFALEGADQGVWDYNAQTKQVFLSSKWKKILGYKENEIKNDVAEWENRLHPNDKQAAIQEIRDYCAGLTSSYVKEYRLLSKDGTYKWVFSQAKVISRCSYGKPLRIIGTIMDITERQKAQTAIKESEEKFSAAFYSSGAALAISRLHDGLILDVNEYFLKTFGYKREEVIGKTVKELNLYADLTDRQTIVNLTLKNQQVINQEVKGNRKDKTEVTGLLSTKIFTIKGQKHLLTTIIDITNLKNVEKTLFLRQNELENFFALVPDAVIIGDLTGKIVDCNELSSKTFGYSKSEIIGSNGLIFIEEHTREKLVKQFVKALENKQVQTSMFTAKCKNGKEILVEAAIKAVYDDQKKPTGFIANIRDITERNLVERKLQESEERYRFMAEHAQDLITVTDLNGNIFFVSPSIKRLAGFDSDELVGKKTVMSCIHEADLPRLISSIQESAASNIPVQVEVRLLTKKGQNIWLEANINPVKDTAGKAKFITISRDITQRKIDHEERNQALEKAEMLLKKLSVVGGFVRHDVRNKLSIITSTLYLCKKYAEANNNLFMQSHISQIEQASSSIDRILEFSQTYEAVGSKGLSWCAVNKAVDQARILFPNLCNVELITEDIDFEVLADSALVEIFHNLIDNSVKYGVNLTKIRVFSRKKDNINLELIYEDNGGGIDPQIKLRLFQKGAGKGTGLGLYLIQRVCDIYGWQVTEQGDPGKFSRFIIEIPLEKTRKIS
ncbi:MAG: PAS domain S-box protein [Candidatus Bathyarchaeia archaeon]